MLGGGPGDGAGVGGVGGGRNKQPEQSSIAEMNKRPETHGVILAGGQAETEGDKQRVRIST